MSVTIYGIRNCDTMKKAFAFLEARGVPYRFHDYRVAGLDRPTLSRWTDRVGWEALLNRSSATFRALPAADRNDLDAARATALMLANPTMIRRPVLEKDERLLLGFKPDLYAAEFGG